VWDHNCDNPTNPIDALSDAGAKALIDGSAFYQGWIGSIASTILFAGAVRIKGELYGTLQIYG